MTTTRTTAKADNEYMVNFPFVFFIQQQRLCSIRMMNKGDNDKKRQSDSKKLFD